ncbi:DUF6089 family protein [Reichenbachiella sp. MSK19-1]|uniref:DUF6089 family protein n=1 Tax=Reichenbachiella sp. MSK19-1 TaxID=1897631 RepID=UPI000E6C8DBB|nr:DUF6089 family protein [Reichenbachiella sp. MSK19-1]RJE72960.1 hypothetical protein BGP76_03160 [Reichenbachiella sp. MSK19-1]
MLRTSLFVIFFLSAFASQSQNFFDWRYHDRYFSVFAGTGWTGYLGDLTNGSPLTSGLSHFNVGAEARLYSKIAVRAQYATYKLEGSDRNAADSSYNRQRNLSFHSQNHEWQLQMVYYLFKYKGKYYKRRVYEPYIAIGGGQTFFNPKADLTNSEGKSTTYTLRDYQTETENYKGWAWIIPVNIGIKLVITEFINLGVDVGYRYAFTGHLDDVYGDYANPNGDGQGYPDGTIDASLSNRKFEDNVYIINQDAFDEMIPGQQRGNGKFDSYFLMNVNLEVYLPKDVFKSKKGRGRKGKILGKRGAYD